MKKILLFLAAAYAAISPARAQINPVLDRPTFKQMPIFGACSGGVVVGSGPGATAQCAALSPALEIVGGALRTKAISGDCASAAGSLALTCAKTNGVAFSPSATIDATNAANVLLPAGFVAGAQSVALNNAFAVGLPISPEFFGAVQGTADSTAAIQSWLNSGLPLACNGTYTIKSVVTANLAAGGKGLSLIGGGRNCKIILNPTATVRGSFGGSATVVSGGTGYALYDEMPCVGGTLAAPGVGCTIHVTALANTATATATVSGGVVTAFSVTSGGSNYSQAYPPPVYVSGAGCARGPKGYATVSAAGIVTGISVKDGGGSGCTAASVTIGAPKSGPVGAAEIWNGGAYTVEPANPIAVGASLRGSSGSGATFNVTFVTQAAPAGIVINLPVGDYVSTPQVTLRNVTIAPAQLIGSWPALTVRAGGTSGSTDPLMIVDNVNVMPTNAPSASLECWRFIDVTVSNFKDSTCQSSRTYATAPGLKGLVIQGTGASTTTFNVNGVNIFNADECIYITGKMVQGIVVRDTVPVLCNIGVHIAPSDNNFIMADFSGINTNALQASFLLENAPQVTIHNTLLNQLKRGRNSPISACIWHVGQAGVAIESIFHDFTCSTWQAHQDNAATYTAGVILENTYGGLDGMGVRIHDAHFIGAYYGIVASNTSRLVAHDNQCALAYGPTFACIYSYGGNSGFLGTIISNGAYALYTDAASSFEQPPARVTTATTGNQNAGANFP